ncbi:MAG: heme exporter protein CcmD [Alphaproteobacteria bacterium]|nr:heme exporter protein CcmD [Alphaproteobacteria bacterium]
MEALSAFLAMGGHGAFVWPAYGAAALILVGVLVASLARLRREERTLAALAAGATRRGRAKLRAAAEAEAGAGARS